MLATQEATMVEIQRRRFSVDEYYRMGEAGILRPDERVELIDGEVHVMPPIGPGHASIVDRLTDRLFRRVGDIAIVRVQNPIRLNNYTEPQPDLALLRRRDDFYAAAHPQPEDILVVIEVADTTLAYDRREKLPRYAGAGIPEVWIVNIAARLVEQYTQSQGAAYVEQRSLKPGDTLISSALPALALAVDEILGS